MFVPDSLRDLRESYTSETLTAIEDRLSAEKTLEIVPLPSGLFSAAVTNDFSAGTQLPRRLGAGQRSMWPGTLAYRTGVTFRRPSPRSREWRKVLHRARRTVRCHHCRSDRQGRCDPATPHTFQRRQQPGVALMQWAHAQNDALGVALAVRTPGHTEPRHSLGRLNVVDLDMIEFVKIPSRDPLLGG